jgi:nitroreductase
MSVIETIRGRHSWRTFSSEQVEPEKLDILGKFMASNTKGVFGSELRFELINFNDTPNELIKSMGTYSVIKGARIFMAGCVKKSGRYLEDYGYTMEKNILKAAGLGLATCWLGATFDRNGFSERLNCAPDEVVPGISPVGYAADKRRLADSMMRMVANSDSRKHLFEISFVGDFQSSNVPAGKYKTVLECVKAAPSATNQQPWRFLREEASEKPPVYHLYLERTKGYIYPPGQNIDLGIAMCHFELAARELGLDGDWQISDHSADAGGREYVATWK